METTLGQAKLEKKILVFYHGGCWDGFTAAWVAHKKFGDEAEYIAADFNQVPDVKGKDIYMVDISVSDHPEDIKKLLESNRVVLIDHHVTRQNLIPLFKESHFALDRSGAMLTWEYFYPGQQPPMLIEYVQDEDLWNWKVPFSNNIMTAVRLNELTFQNWDRIAMDLEDEEKKNQYIEKGKLLNDYFNSLCDSLIEDMTILVDFEGHKIYAINVPHMFASVIGHMLAKKSGTFAIMWRLEPDGVHASMRSVEDFDVSVIAKKYGGGGHKNAASFKFQDFSQVPWKVIKETNN
ncbi:MAG: hypothetical protein A3I39_00540 [Candidatus Yanofskybacteria bacterium RIFCSPLOWO2_02_FULL_47_9b]|uniref:DHHA1 domain-containing protein n=1 Tax=Candidatus Yanofskybacteria bacterium RIFCSPLOWO2_02_FULL_47_9b TaxID=1802708 RepID=A0A1F8H6P8_9BACT|nr:MAG: hypothetical protein A3I39_00540 [Candidatus Yanofskybacteria bacterium RIFCSPLOWO2_02_FULL_47_9b]